MKPGARFSRCYGIGAAKWVCAVGVLWGTFGQLFGAEQPPRGLEVTGRLTKRCALLVTVEPDLPVSEAYRTNDAHWLAEQLAQSGYAPEHILLMTQRADKPDYHPLRKNLEKQIEELLRQTTAQDGLLIYWAGQAYQSGDQELWLAAADWNPARAAETGISVGWLRKQLEACQAEWKLLILDTPFQQQAGLLRSVGSEAVLHRLEGTPGLALLASSRAEQPSPIWFKVGQSNFGFWLVQAFAGHADRNENNQLTFQELVAYLFAQVSKTAREVFRLEQCPTWYPATESQEDPSLVVAAVANPSLADVLERFAELLSQTALQHQVCQMAVAEFRPLADDSLLQRLLDGGPGILGRWCAEKLQNALQQKASLAGFRVLPYADFHAALSRNRYTPQLLQTSAVRSLSVQGRTPEAAVLGTFTLCMGRRLTIRCQLQHFSTGRTLGRFQQTALLTSDELAMLGLDPAVPVPAGHPPQAPALPEASASDQPSGQPPASDRPADSQPGFRVMIYVDGLPRPAQKLWDKECVLLRRGEVYKIVIENPLTEPVYLRLLVDGLNTLPEPVLASGSSSESPRYEYLPAQRVHLQHAKAWRLEGRHPAGPPKRYSIEGFYRRKETTFPGKALYEWDSFKVVDPPQSWAALREYTEQIGIITAAFYAVPSPTRDRVRPGATGRGPTLQGEIQEYQETPVGPLLQVIHLYYALLADNEPMPFPPLDLRTLNPPSQ